MSSGYTGLWTFPDTSSIPNAFGAHGGPLVLYRSDGSCIVMSPLTSFITANMVSRWSLRARASHAADVLGCVTRDV